MSDRQTAIVFGHSSPVKDLLINSYTEAWRRVGQGTKKPRAVLFICTTGT